MGVITRGTTNPNRLRRVDRWLAGPQAFRLRPAAGAGPAEPPIVVDLGYGASPTTTVELFQALGRVEPAVQVVGIEIDPERVRVAEPLARHGLSFARGGFEVPLPGGRSARIIRAFNVLRQYDQDQVPQAWATMTARLDPGGLLVEGTCDEIGRISSWVALDADGPLSLTVSVHLRTLALPSDVAPRLPKALIHRNVPGEPVHDFLGAWDRSWLRASAIGAYGARQRFRAAAEDLAQQGWPVRGGPGRWRLGELTVDWAAVAPRGDQSVGSRQ